MLRLTVDISVQRLVVAARENSALQVTFLTELNPQTRGLPGRDPLPQLAVGDGEAPVRVLAGHLVLIVESHAVGGP